MRLHRLPALFLAFLAMAFQASPGDRAGVTPAIAGIAEQWARLWGAKQLDPIVALYAPDAVFLTGTGDRITGKAAIRDAFKKGMAATTKLSVRSVRTESSGNLAYDSGDYRETITFANGVARENRGSYIILFRRQADGRWLIAEHAWTEAPRASR